ncbi:unnamed protein product, partial [Scytosiphon promiscuus]
ELRYHRGLGHHSPPLSHLTRDAPTYPHEKDKTAAIVCYVQLGQMGDEVLGGKSLNSR